MSLVIKMDINALKASIRENIYKHRRLYMAEGLFFIAAGLIALGIPGVAAEISTLFLGIVILASGLSQLYLSTIGKRPLWFFAAPLLFSAVGLTIIIWPEKGSIALATLIGIFLTIKGFSEIIAASFFAPLAGWGWILLSGILTLFLSALVWAGWPVSAVWFLGALIGLNFLTFGLSLFLFARNHKPTNP